jgi:hypothetical protein
LTHDIEGGASNQSWDAPIFDHMGNETDGLVTKRSVGYQQR